MRRLREVVERWLCRRLGHDWAVERRAAPVTCFALCRRCGKVGPRLAEEHWT